MAGQAGRRSADTNPQAGIALRHGDAEPLKYFLSTAPGDATLEQIVFVTKMRWRIERDYRELKREFGLGHYEGRGWQGFHHHATLCIAAYGFLTAQRLNQRDAKKLHTAKGACPSRRLHRSWQRGAYSATCMTPQRHCDCSSPARLSARFIGVHAAGKFS